VSLGFLDAVSGSEGTGREERREGEKEEKVSSSWD